MKKYPAEIKSNHQAKDWLIAAIVAGLVIAFLTSLVTGMEELAGQFNKYPVGAENFKKGLLANERLFDYSPLLLALCIIASNLSSQPSQLVLWVQLICTACTASLIFLILRRHTGVLLAFSASLSFILLPSVLIYCHIFEPEPLMMFLVVLVVYLAGCNGLFANFGTGLALCLSLLTRPAFLVFVLVIPLYYILAGKDQRWLRCSLVFLFPVLMGVAALGYSAKKLDVDFPPPIMNPGTVFFEGNHPAANGRGVAYPLLAIELAYDYKDESDYQHAIYRLLARRSAQTELSASEVNRFWARKAFNFIIDEPGTYLKKQFRKVLFTFHSYRWHNMHIAHLADANIRNKGLPLLPLGMVTALSLCGLILCLRRWRSYLLYYAAFASQTCLMLATYASDRQRLSLLPFVVIFAAFATHKIYSLNKGRAWLVCFVLLLCVILSKDYSLMLRNQEMWQSYNSSRKLQWEAWVDRENFRYSSSLRKSAFALVEAPWAVHKDVHLNDVPAPQKGMATYALNQTKELESVDPGSILNRIILQIDARQLSEANRLLDKIEQADITFERLPNRPAEIGYYRGRIAFLNGNKAEASFFMNKALQHSPGDPDILAHMFVITRQQKYAVKLNRYYDKADAEYHLGKAYFENGMADKSVHHFTELYSLLPEFRRGKLYLAAALSEAGDYRQSTSMYLEAMEQDNDPTMFPGPTLAAFKNWAEASPAGDIAWYWYAKVLRQFGEHVKAREILRTLAEITGQKIVSEELRALEAAMSQAGLL